MPELVAYNWIYPQTVMSLDAQTFDETHHFYAIDWPVSDYLRNGNIEGTHFSDNPNGSVMMQASFTLNAENNWLNTQFIPNAEFYKRFIRNAYDPHKDVVYGLAPYSPDKKDRFAFTVMYAGERTDSESGATVKPLQNITALNDNLPANAECSALGWDPRDGNVLGVGVDGKLYRFNTTDGSMTELFDTGHANSPFFGSLAYSPTHGGFLWVYLVRGDTGVTVSQDYYLIDTEAKTCTLLKSVPRDQETGLTQVSSLMVNKQYADPKGPQPVTVTESWQKHSASGRLTVNVPTRAEDGTLLSGPLKYMVRIDGIKGTDGKSFIEREVQPGTVRTEQIDDLDPGARRITIYTCTEDGHWSRAYNLQKFVGFDTPVPPANVVLTKEKLSWDPVTLGMHGEDLSQDGVSYEVWVDEKLVGTTSDTSYTMDFDPNELHSYLAAVCAVNHNYKSSLSFSDRVVVGEYNNLPVTHIPDASSVLLSTYTDRDGNENNWGYLDSYKAWVSNCNYNNLDEDNWLILPAINFDDPEALYDISFDLLTANYDENIQVRLLDEPLAGTGTPIYDKVINTVNYAGANNFLPLSARFSIPESGVKYIAFRVDGQTLPLYLRNVKIEKSGSNKNAPGAVSNLQATAGAEGSLTSTVSFTFPSKTVGGEDIPASTLLTAEVSGVYTTFEPATVTGHAGEPATIIFTTPEGKQVVSVCAKIGENAGPGNQGEFFAGFDVPGKVKNFTLTHLAGARELEINWENPGTVGHNGGYASPEGLKYYLLVRTPSASKWSRYDPVDEEGLLFTAAETFPQTLTDFAVMTENVKGASNDWDKANITIGKSYSLPMRENLYTGSTQFTPYVTQNPTEEYTGSAGFADPRQLNAEYAVPGDRVIGLMPPSDGSAGKARVELPYFSTVGSNEPYIIFQALIDPEISAQADVYAYTYGVEPVRIGGWDASTPGRGYVSVPCKLPASLAGKEWVQIAVDGTFAEGERKFVVFQRYSVQELAANDLSLLSVSTPDHMRINRDATITAVVANLSNADKPAPKLSISVTDRKGVTTVTEVQPADASPIGPDAERTYTFSLTPTADLLGSMDFVVSLPDDDVAENNRYEATGTVETGDAIISSQLTAVRSESDPAKVELAWNEPKIFNGTEDVEQMSSFDISEDLGAFKNLDLDGSITYTWQNWDFPHEEDPHAFIVFDDTWDQIPEASKDVLKARSGHKVLMALAPLNYRTANDWLISPEVEPGSEVSFWVNQISNQYGADQIGLYYSDGSTNPDDFTMLTYLRKRTWAGKKLRAKCPRAPSASASASIPMIPSVSLSTTSATPPQAAS